MGRRASIYASKLQMCSSHNNWKTTSHIVIQRNIKNIFPSKIVEKLTYDKEVRGRQDKKYGKVKKYFDEKHNVKKRDDTKAGDQVLVKHNKRKGKFSQKSAEEMLKKGF